MTKLTTKEIKAFNKEALIKEIQLRGGGGNIDLKSLKRDELRHLLHEANRPAQAKSKPMLQPHSSTKSKGLSAGAKELKSLYSTAYKRAKRTGMTEKGKEALDLLNDMLAMAQTREDKIQAYKAYLRNPYTKATAQRYEERETLNALKNELYSGNDKDKKKHKPQFIWKKGKWYIREYQESAGGYVINELTKFTHTYWHLMHRLKEEVNQLTSDEIFEIIDKNRGQVLSFEQYVELARQKYEAKKADNDDKVSKFDSSQYNKG